MSSKPHECTRFTIYCAQNDIAMHTRRGINKHRLRHSIRLQQSLPDERLHQAIALQILHSLATSLLHDLQPMPQRCPQPPPPLQLQAMHDDLHPTVTSVNVVHSHRFKSLQNRRLQGNLPNLSPKLEPNGYGTKSFVEKAPIYFTASILLNSGQVVFPLQPPNGVRS